MEKLILVSALSCLVFIAAFYPVNSASVERAKRQYPGGNNVQPPYQDTTAGYPGVDLVRSAIDWMKILLKGIGWKPSWDPNVWKDSASRLINTMWYGETVEEAHARQSGHYFITTPNPYGSVVASPGSRTITGPPGPGVSVYVNPNGVLPPVPRHPAQKPAHWNETVTDIFEVVDKELRQEAA